MLHVDGGRVGDTQVCSDYLNGLDPKDHCRTFGSEIMITGYCILLITLLIFATGAWRARLRYVSFYRIHLATLGLFVLAILHTMDDEFRAGSRAIPRSQSSIWIGGPFTLYLADRLWAFVSTTRASILKTEISEGTLHTMVRCKRRGG